MTPVKRFEIVVDRLHVADVLAALERAGAGGYTVLGEATGKGDRGTRWGGELTGVFANACVIAAAPVEAQARVIDEIRPILREAGGMCLVSDAQWVKH